MFLFEKYKPNSINDFFFNKEIVNQLIHISKNDDIPHLIISGPKGGGKKTLVKFFLENVYDKDINILTKIKYNVNGSSTKKEIEIMQSNYHIIIEPTSTNHDKYILQEIIKQYASHRTFNIFKSGRNFKTIVIHDIENLANNTQAALRRTMELYAKTCRFVMICNNLSKVFDPLRSRCRTFCVPTPTIENIRSVISYIALMENIKMSNKDMTYILDNSGNNLKKAIWMLDSKRLNCESLLTLDKIFNDIAEMIINSRNNIHLIKLFNNKIRTNIYNILINNIKGSDIIKILLDLLITKINNDHISSKIIRIASEAEFNLIHGRRDISNIDYFIIGVIRELINYYADKENEGDEGDEGDVEDV